MIGSDREVKYSTAIEHTLLCNEAYIHFNFPYDWWPEALVELEEKPKGITFNFGNTALKAKTKQIIVDATFTRNGYIYLVEIDNTRHMQDNFKKLKKYKEMWSDIKNKYQMQPVLYFFTTTETRKRKLMSAAKGMNVEVMTFGEIK